jgi:hypothetical protein
VGSEDRAERDPMQVGRDVLRRKLGAGDPVDRLREPRAAREPVGCKLASPVHLLGDVREVEEGGERPRQARRAGGVELGEQLRRGPAIAGQQVARALEEVQQLRPLLTCQRAAEEQAELGEVTAQSGMLVCLRRRTGAR